MHADRVKPNFDQCYLLRLLSLLMDYYNTYEGQATVTNRQWGQPGSVKYHCTAFFFQLCLLESWDFFALMIRM